MVRDQGTVAVQPAVVPALLPHRVIEGAGLILRPIGAGSRCAGRFYQPRAVDRACTSTSSSITCASGIFRALAIS